MHLNVPYNNLFHHVLIYGNLNIMDFYQYQELFYHLLIISFSFGLFRKLTKMNKKIDHIKTDFMKHIEKTKGYQYFVIK